MTEIDDVMSDEEVLAMLQRGKGEFELALLNADTPEQHEAALMLASSVDECLLLLPDGLFSGNTVLTNAIMARAISLTDSSEECLEMSATLVRVYGQNINAMSQAPWWEDLIHQFKVHRLEERLAREDPFRRLMRQRKR